MARKDYSTYRFSGRDIIEYLIFLLIKGFFIGYLFYDTYKVILFLIPFFYLDYRDMKKRKLHEQKEELTKQFQSMLEALMTSLYAGYSLERSFLDAKRDLELLYDEKSDIFMELDIILTGLNMNVPLGTLLLDFGYRSGIEDIENFARVVIAAKKSGGNLIQIMQKTVNSISDKLAVEEEIQTMITAKKYEGKIMMLMPYIMILYLRIANKGFLDVLYHNTLGVIFMTFVLLGIYLSDLWAKRIMEIQV